VFSGFCLGHEAREEKAASWVKSHPGFQKSKADTSCEAQNIICSPLNGVPPSLILKKKVSSEGNGLCKSHVTACVQLTSPLWRCPQADTSS